VPRERSRAAPAWCSRRPKAASIGGLHGAGKCHGPSVKAVAATSTLFIVPSIYFPGPALRRARRRNEDRHATSLPRPMEDAVTASCGRGG